MPGVQLCLELLFTLAVHNADRAQLLWPTLHDVLADMLTPRAASVAGRSRTLYDGMRSENEPA